MHFLCWNLSFSPVLTQHAKYCAVKFFKCVWVLYSRVIAGNPPYCITFLGIENSELRASFGRNDYTFNKTCEEMGYKIFDGKILLPLNRLQPNFDLTVFSKFSRSNKPSFTLPFTTVWGQKKTPKVF